MDNEEAVWKWYHWAVSGSEPLISQLISNLDANLPIGWRRLSSSESGPYLALFRDDAAWYSKKSDLSDFAVTVTIQRFGQSKLSGSYVWFGDPSRRPLGPPPSEGPDWIDVMCFLDAGIIRATKEVGATFKLPTREENFFSELSIDLRNRLRSFSKAASRTLPFGKEDADRWRQFVVAAFRERVSMNLDLFVKWLVADGWTLETARELQLRLVDDFLLLVSYSDEVLAA